MTGGDTYHYTTEEDAFISKCRDISMYDFLKLEKKMFPCGESNPGRGGESAES